MRFTDRLGRTQPPKLHNEEVSEELLVALWNTFQPVLFAGASLERSTWRGSLLQVYEYLDWRTSDLSFTPSREITKFQDWFFDEDERDWADIYNFVDFIGRHLYRVSGNKTIFHLFNEVLQSKGSPYRFVAEELTPITDPIESDSVEQAIGSANGLDGAREHLRVALQKLGLRPEPDFRNAMKEAVSAVESTLKVFADKPQADLRAALKEFVKTHTVHPALQGMLDKLYGYTSNEPGVRHALIDADANVGFAEAKFMVVACSGFVNYLIAKNAD
jgi:hypothetical protein